jgi:hypothetical protein
MDEKIKLEAIRSVLAGGENRSLATVISSTLQEYGKKFLNELKIIEFEFEIENTIYREVPGESYYMRCVVQTITSPLRMFYIDLAFYVDSNPQFEFTTSTSSAILPQQQAAQKQHVEDQYVVNFDPRMTPETFASRNSAKAKEILQRISLFYQRQ